MARVMLYMYSMKTKQKQQCQKCGEKNASIIYRDCVTWGREIRLCTECAVNMDGIKIRNHNG